MPSICPKHILIKGHGSVSAFGSSFAQEPKTSFTAFSGKFGQIPAGAIPAEEERHLEELLHTNPRLKGVDRTVLLAVLATRQAVQRAGWGPSTNVNEMAVNLGSSRGATGAFEKHYDSFLHNNVAPQASPVTTLGNISSWVAQDLQVEGPVISHSITCSTAIQSIANAMAWLRSGMASRFLAGAAEAPLTPFTFAQMQALGIYAPSIEHPFPSRPCNPEGQNTFVLGEGAAVFALEAVSEEELRKPAERPRVIIEAVGFGFELIKSKTGISEEGLHFQKAMRQALAQAENPAPPDLILMHAPGTVAGDRAELQAIKAVFGEKPPAVFSNKWLFGHTLGAAAALSLAQAIHVLHTQEVPTFPYPISFENATPPSAINRILINAAGFGGNAASLLVTRVPAG